MILFLKDIVPLKEGICSFSWEYRALIMWLWTTRSNDMVSQCKTLIQDEKHYSNELVALNQLSMESGRHIKDEYCK